MTALNDTVGIQITNAIASALNVPVTSIYFNIDASLSVVIEVLNIPPSLWTQGNNAVLISAFNVIAPVISANVAARGAPQLTIAALNAGNTTNSSVSVGGRRSLQQVIYAEAPAAAPTYNDGIAPPPPAAQLAPTTGTVLLLTFSGLGDSPDAAIDVASVLSNMTAPTATPTDPAGGPSLLASVSGLDAAMRNVVEQGATLTVIDASNATSRRSLISGAARAAAKSKLDALASDPTSPLGLLLARKGNKPRGRSGEQLLRYKAIAAYNAAAQDKSKGRWPKPRTPPAASPTTTTPSPAVAAPGRTTPAAAPTLAAATASGKAGRRSSVRRLQQ